MAGIRWQGMDIDSLTHRIESYNERIMPVMVEIVTETVAEGAERQELALNAATTKTGEDRYGSGQGGSAGRNDTGDTIARIETDVIQEGNKVTGTWGWNDPDGKIIAQEFGIGNPPAAHSLATSFIPTRESFKARVQKATK